MANIDLSDEGRLNSALELEKIGMKMDDAIGYVKFKYLEANNISLSAIEQAEFERLQKIRASLP